jgi:hypothetical protein
MATSITTSDQPKEEKFPIQELFFKNFKAKLDKNSRLLFSGKFGVGKSYFLQEFFQKNQDKYNCVHLSPVYYSTAKNEDIFQSIEADIFVHLLDKYMIKEEFIENHASSLLISQYLLNNAKELGNDTLDIVKGFVPVISVFQRSFDVIVKHLDKFKIHNGKMQTDQVFEAYKKLAENNKTNTASVYGRTPYQNMLADALQEIKANKENVLIIDDLDRIDPAHIFRILNVFSACLKADDKADLLGFDKVILVCDNENLKNIFHHFYGDKTDYQGYMSKFNEDIFEYDFADVIAMKLPKDNIRVLLGDIHYDLSQRNNLIITIVFTLFEQAVKNQRRKNLNKQVTVRNVQRTSKDIKNNNTSFSMQNGFEYLEHFHHGLIKKLFRDYEMADYITLYASIKDELQKNYSYRIENFFTTFSSKNIELQIDETFIKDVFSGDNTKAEKRIRTLEGIKYPGQD